MRVKEQMRKVISMLLVVVILTANIGVSAFAKEYAEDVCNIEERTVEMEEGEKLLM